MSSRSFFTGLVLGSIAGAVSSLVLSPKAGNELKDKVYRQVDTIKEKAEEWIIHTETELQDTRSKGLEIRKPSQNTKEQVTSYISIR